MSTAAVSGLGSGVDWRKLIDDLIAVERKRVELWEQRKSAMEANAGAWAAVGDKLAALSSAVEALCRAETFLAKKATSSDEGILAATCTTEAASGTHSIVVTALAKAHTVTSGSFSSRSEALGVQGTFKINGIAVTLTTDDTLDAVATKINQAGAGVTAYVLLQDTQYRLVIRSNQTGSANSIVFEDDPDYKSLASLEILDAAGAIANEVQPARDAQIQLDGLTITRSQNTISDAIAGLTLTLRAESASEVLVEVKPDVAAVKSSIDEFVNAYNEAIGEISKHLAKGGALQGETRLISLWSKIRTAASGWVEGCSGSFDRLAEIGISSSSTSGTLTVDSQKLEDAIDSSPSDVALLFSDAASAVEGIGEKLKAILDEALDNYHGTVAVAQQSISARIEDLEEQVARYEAYLELRRTNLERQFLALERTIAEMSWMGWQGLWWNLNPTGQR